MVWNPHTEVQRKRIESIQKRFLKFALRNLGWADPFVLPSYESRLLLLDMNTLIDRRKAADTIFMHKLMSDQLDVPELKEKITLNANPYQTRHREILRVHTHSTNYGANEPLSRCSSVFNEHVGPLGGGANLTTKRRALLNDFKLRSVIS